MTEPFNNDELSISDFAALLSVTGQSVRNWIKAGKIAHVRIGDHVVRIPRAELERVKRTIPAATDGVST